MTVYIVLKKPLKLNPYPFKHEPDGERRNLVNRLFGMGKTTLLNALMANQPTQSVDQDTK